MWEGIQHVVVITVIEPAAIQVVVAEVDWGVNKQAGTYTSSAERFHSSFLAVVHSMPVSAHNIAEQQKLCVFSNRSRLNFQHDYLLLERKHPTPCSAQVAVVLCCLPSRAFYATICTAPLNGTPYY